MDYAELIAGTSRKFYQVDVLEEDNLWKVVFSWGRIGTTGQRQVKFFHSKYEAEHAAREQFESKLAKGYVRKNALQALGNVFEENDESADAEPLDLKVPVEIPEEMKPAFETAMRKLGKIKVDVVNASHELRETLRGQAVNVLKALGRAWAHGGPLHFDQRYALWQAVRNAIFERTVHGGEQWLDYQHYYKIPTSTGDCG